MVTNVYSIYKPREVHAPAFFRLPFLPPQPVNLPCCCFSSFSLVAGRGCTQTHGTSPSVHQFCFCSDSSSPQAVQLGKIVLEGSLVVCRITLPKFWTE